MNRKDRIVYKELSESSAVRLAAVQKSQGELQGEQNRDSRTVFLCIKFPLYVNLACTELAHVKMSTLYL